MSNGCQSEAPAHRYRARGGLADGWREARANEVSHQGPTQTMNALACRSMSTNVVQSAQKEARRDGLLQNVVLECGRLPSLGQSFTVSIF